MQETKTNLSTTTGQPQMPETGFLLRVLRALRGEKPGPVNRIEEKIKKCQKHQNPCKAALNPRQRKTTQLLEARRGK
jgi:hypothetical protein